MNWISLTFLSSFFSATTSVFERLLLKDKDSDPIAFSFIFQVSVAILFLVYAITTKTWEKPSLSLVWLNILYMSLLYGVGSVLIFFAYKMSEASEISILFATSAVWSTISAVLFLGNKVSGKQLIGITLVLLGSVIINIKKTRWKLSKGHIFAMLGAMMFGGAFVNDAFILVNYSSIPSYMVIAFALPAFISLAIRPSSIRNLSKFLLPKEFLSILFCALIYAFAAITVFSAIKIGGQPAIVNMLRQSGLLFTVMLSYFLLSEKDNMKNKVIAVLLAVSGGFLLI